MVSLLSHNFSLGLELIGQVKDNCRQTNPKLSEYCVIGKIGFVPGDFKSQRAFFVTMECGKNNI